MKLIHIYIENFGCLSQYELQFDDGLTVIREDNGFGKTTLAEFIRAMFYGFPRAAKSLEKNRRKRYLPWGGGVCGGHLTFELEGVRYRIERTFGIIPKEDRFTLIDLTTNRKSTRFSEDIGPELFGLDADSFERSVYMSQLHEAEALSTDSIRAKLGNLVEDTNDVGNFEKAVAALKAKRSTFVPYRGSGGSVAEARYNISLLQQKLDTAEAKRSSLGDLHQEVQALSQQLNRDEKMLAQVRVRLTEASRGAASEAVRLQHRRMEAQREELRNSLDRRFDRGSPTAEAFDKADRDCEEYLSVTAQFRSAGVSAGERAQLKALETFFEPGVPDEEMLDRLTHDQRRLVRLQAELESQRLSDQERMLLERGDVGKRKGNLWGELALILGLLTLGGGVLLLVGRNVIPGIILPGIGALLTVLGISGIGREKLRRQRTDYLTVSQRAEELERSRSRIRQEMASCRRRLHGELAPYFGSECDPEQAIVELRLKCSRFLELRQLRSEAEGRADALRRRAEELATRLRFFLADYYSEIHDDRFGQLVNQLRRDWDAHNRTCHQLEELEQQLKAYCQEHGGVLNRVEEIPDPERLKREEQRLHDRIDSNKRSRLAKEQHVELLRHEIDSIPELRDALERWQQRKDADQNRADTLDRTLEFLQQARESLSGNYLSTIQRSFGRYLERLSGEDRQKILITGDLEVQLERQGQSRELGYFSTGQADLVMLCMRFALVDALFTEEKPFVILDDPFVNLDDARTAEALTLLRDLSQERQIIYLVCNSSRAE